MNTMFSLPEEHKHLVKASFAKVAMRSVTFSELFFTQLFWADKSLVALINAPKSEQNRKLIPTMSAVIGLLDKPEVMRTSMQEIAVELAKHGVTRKHYTAFRKALITSLDRVLGENFTPEVKEAWMSLYELLAGIGLEAAYSKA